jgi:hypothetical protein
VSENTVTSWLNGLEMWHSFNGAPWHGGRILKRTKRGIAKLTPLSSRRPPREPVSYQHMLTLRHNLDLSNTRDAAIWATACTAWCGICRLGELLPSTNSLDTSRHVTRNCTIRRGTASNYHNFISFFVPRTKTSITGDWITLTASNDTLDPVAALEHHLFINNACPPSSSLFAYDSIHGYSTLTKPDFIHVCNTIWSSNGLGAIQGHGFRIGGTTYLLLKGVSPWIVMKQGRWSSKAFLKYWRKVESILPLFIGDAFDKIHNLRMSVFASLGLS